MIPRQYKEAHLIGNMAQGQDTGAFVAHSTVLSTKFVRGYAKRHHFATPLEQGAGVQTKDGMHMSLNVCGIRRVGIATAASVLAAAVLHASGTGPVLMSAYAASANVKFPPIDRTDANRCEPTSSAIGQANAARDKLLDLRECDLRSKDMSGFDLSGGLFSEANLEDANLKDAQLSKSYAPRANFRNVNFTNAVVDRVTFDNADLSNAIFENAVLSDSTFDGANLENVDFTDVYIGDFAQRNICRNPTMKGENPVTGAPTRESLGCR